MVDAPSHRQGSFRAGLARYRHRPDQAQHYDPVGTVSDVAVPLDHALVFEDFADKVGEVFTISDEGVPGIPLTLTEAEPLTPAAQTATGPHGVRPPFSLIFVARDPSVIPQRIYRLEHKGLGELSIFLVPVGKDANGVSYQATFN